MRIAILTSEAVPFAKTGGLADVCGALPKALQQQDIDARLILPLYEKIKRDLHLASTGVTEAMARIKGLANVTGEAKCAGYRAQFLTVVKARNVYATCKTGADRDQDVGRLDGTIEDINGSIAESCQ